MSHKRPEELKETAKTLLEEYLPQKDTMKAKQRIGIPVQDMPAQDPIVRIGNLDEVALGYSEEQAKLEALRCTQCKKRPCIEACPVKIDIPGFIQHIADGEFQKSIDVIKQSSLLPAICGRVCPQEVQCQQPCTVSKSLKDVAKGVSIGRLERFAADWEQANGSVKIPEVKPETGKKVAVIGAGPAGLVVAA
ncbi:MAG: dihydropyrimidine dehydrogenase, partial [Deltaproteobacteria bacterium]|nr:dihydropyrimidine dehydrogenase [Deltaproteobacteria bacterium]